MRNKTGRFTGFLWKGRDREKVNPGPYRACFGYGFLGSGQGPETGSTLNDHGSAREIRARYGSGLLLKTPSFRKFVQISVQFYTLFLKSPYNRNLRQSGHFALTYKTLLYAFGGQNSGSDRLLHVAIKRRPVLGVGFRAPSYGSSDP